MKKKIFIYTSAIGVLVSSVLPVTYNLYVNSQQKTIEDAERNNLKNSQIEKFKNVSYTDIENVLKESKFTTYLQSQNTKMLENEIGRDYFDLSDYSDDIFSNALSIINGDVLIEDLQKKCEENISQFPDLNNLYEDSLKNNYITTQINNMEQNIIVNQSEDIVHDDELSDQDKVNILLDYERVEVLLQKLDMYKNYSYGMAVSYSTLTAIAGAATIFYWGAGGMGGANVAFAVSTTLQATSLSVATGYAGDSGNFSISEFNTISSYLNSNLTNDQKANINNILKKYQNGQTTGETIHEIGLLFSEEVLQKILEKVIVKTITRFKWKIATTFKNYRIVFFTTQKTLYATMGSNPIATALTILSSVLTLTDLVGSITFAYGLKA